MRTSHAITVWMFDRLGLDGALAGDLLEERARGRSTVWYWRQVLIGILVGMWGTIRDHKLMALRAVATGFAMELLFLFLWNQFSPLLPDWPTFSTANLIFNYSLMLATQAAVGWVIGRTHRTRPMVFVFMFLIFDLLWWGQRTFVFARTVVVGSIHHPGYLPYLVFYMTYTLTLTAGVLGGGIFASRPQRHPSTLALI
jgi:hypothetical protein